LQRLAVLLDPVPIGLIPKNVPNWIRLAGLGTAAGSTWRAQRHGGADSPGNVIVRSPKRSSAPSALRKFP